MKVEAQKRTPFPRAPLLPRGEFFVWLCAAGMCVTLLMLVVLFSVVVSKGIGLLWLHPLVQVETRDNQKALGMVMGEERTPEGELNLQVKVGNRDVYGEDFRWINGVVRQSTPAQALYVERMEYGVFQGFLKEAKNPHPISFDSENPRKSLQALLQDFQPEKEKLEALGLEFFGLEEKIAENPKPSFLQQKKALEKSLIHQTELVESCLVSMQEVEGFVQDIPCKDIVAIYAPNTLGFLEKVGVYLLRFWELLSTWPRESNTEGGVFPAIFGTVVLVMLMSIACVPLGVVAAVYLQEYAKQGFFMHVVRIAVYNLAGVPSIVYGIFGLGFFVYGVGGWIDSVFFSDKLPLPTFGTGGVLWASLTLSLLTVPVVIVATEEGLASIPRGVREGSAALGATQFQTLWRVVLPMASPGIITGFIMAIARAAGEVAPLMVTGVVKLAPALPIDGQAPFFHPESKFMHLGFHIYDLGFQSPNVETAKPMVYMTTLLLVMIVTCLSLLAIYLRTVMRKRHRMRTF